MIIFVYISIYNKYIHACLYTCMCNMYTEHIPLTKIRIFTNRPENSIL